jgi:hypothetical protein
MTEISLSNNLIDTDEEIIAMEREKGRPTNPARHLPDGTYNKQCLDPEYGKKWYHKRYCVPYTCGICGRTLANDQKIKQHENSALCQKAKKKLENVWV